MSVKQFKILVVACFIILLLVVVAAIFLGSMEVDQSQGQAEEVDSDATTTAPVQLESGMLAVYFMAYTGSETTYETVGGQTLTMESSAGAVFRYLPEQDELLIVSHFYSPDYAPNAKHPYTVDGRLFLVKTWSDSGSADFYEGDLGNGTHAYMFKIDTNAGGYSWDDYAVVGNSLYYRTNRIWDPFAYGGHSGGGFYVRDLVSDASSILLLGHGHPDNYGEFISAGGNLYRVKMDWETHHLSINRIDLSTGMISRHLGFTVDIADDLRQMEFAADRDAFYIAACSKDLKVVSLWRLSWTDFEEGNIPWDFWDSGLVYSQGVPEGLHYIGDLDADEGFVVIDLFYGDHSVFILYDHSTGSASTFYPGLDGRHVQILKVRN